MFVLEFSCRIISMSLICGSNIADFIFESWYNCIPFIVNSLYPIWNLHNSYRQLKCVHCNCNLVLPLGLTMKQFLIVLNSKRKISRLKTTVSTLPSVHLNFQATKEILSWAIMLLLVAVKDKRPDLIYFISDCDIFFW